MFGACPGCAAKDQVIALLTTQLEAREKAILALVDKAALAALHPKERPAAKEKPLAPDPYAGREPARPEYDPLEVEQEVEEQFRLMTRDLAP